MSKKKQKEPSIADAERCIELRKRGKRGIQNSPEDYEFCRRMFRRYPEWYSRTEARVFNETVPFGSCARMEE